MRKCLTCGKVCAPDCCDQLTVCVEADEVADKLEAEVLAFAQRYKEIQAKREAIEAEAAELKNALMQRFPVIYILKNRRRLLDGTTPPRFYMTKKSANIAVSFDKKVKAVASENLTTEQILEAADEYVD